MSKKIVIIGAGSMEFTPALISLFTSHPLYEDATIGLVDIHEENLDLMHKLTMRLVNEKNLKIKIEASMERRDLLPGADIVTVAIATGGMDTLEKEVTIPTKYGFIQHGGDTTGPSGLIRALRHIPVMVDIARDCKELCPKAHVYNFTNPMTILTQAMNKIGGMPVTGLCIGPDLTARWLCNLLGIDVKETKYFIAGLNHCHWIVDMRYKGKSVYPMLDQKIAELEMDANLIDKNLGNVAFGEHVPEFCIRIYKHFGYFPGPGDGHISEFFPQFVQSTQEQRKKYGPADQSLLRWMLKNQEEFREDVKKQALGLIPLDEKLFSSTTADEETQITDVELSIEYNLGKTVHINIPNKGYITNLPNDTIVELPVLVDSAGYHPFAIGDLPASITPTLSRLAATYDLIIEAAMEGSREKAVQAFMNDPSCFDMEIGKKCILEMIDAEIDYLPTFKK